MQTPVLPIMTYRGKQKSVGRQACCKMEIMEKQSICRRTRNALDLSCPELLESRRQRNGQNASSQRFKLNSVSLRFASERCDTTKKPRDSFCTPFGVTVEAGLQRRFWRLIAAEGASALQS